MHGNTKLKISLPNDDYLIIQDIIKKGTNKARVITRARVLFQFNRGFSSPSVSKHCDVSPETARRIGWNYLENGLNKALYDDERSGATKRITETDAATVIALACTDPPKGYAKWTVKLLAEEMVKQNKIDSIGRESVRVILKSHGLKPWREKNVVCSKIK